MLYLRTLGDLKLSGPNGDVLLRRRNDLAVLALLADRSPALVRREDVQSLFWGERAEDKARHSLRQVVLQLRRVCGDALEVETVSLRLLPDFVQYDARAFATAAGERRCREAIALWTGDFLTGCEDVGAEGFRAWLDVERERLRRLLAFSYERTVLELETSHDLDRAVQYAGGWIERFPLDEWSHLRFIELLCKIGRLADATVAQGTFVRRLRSEMEETPSEDWLAATERLLGEARSADAADVRSRMAGARATVVPDVVLTPRSSSTETPPTADSRRPMATWRWLVPLFSVAAVIVAVVFLFVRVATARSGRPPALAVGAISSARSTDSLAGFGTLLTMTLSRIPVSI